MIKYVFNPFTANLDIIDVFNTPEIQVVEVDADIFNNSRFVAANPIKVNTERVVLNGLELVMGAEADYTLSNDHIHFTPGVLVVGDRLKITYQIKIG